MDQIRRQYRHKAALRRLGNRVVDKRQLEQCAIAFQEAKAAAGNARAVDKVDES